MRNLEIGVDGIDDSRGARGMNYTASSVTSELEALIARKNLYSDNLKNAKCPIMGLIFEDSRRCQGKPQSCQKGQDRECVHRVSIYMKQGTMYTTLSFRFIALNTNYDGYIYEKDQQLLTLIRRGDITESNLVKIP